MKTGTLTAFERLCDGKDGDVAVLSAVFGCALVDKKTAVGAVGLS